MHSKYSKTFHSFQRFMTWSYHFFSWAVFSSKIFHCIDSKLMVELEAVIPLRKFHIILVSLKLMYDTRKISDARLNQGYHMINLYISTFISDTRKHIYINYIKIVLKKILITQRKYKSRNIST